MPRATHPPDRGLGIPDANEAVRWSRWTRHPDSVQLAVALASVGLVIGRPFSALFAMSFRVGTGSKWKSVARHAQPAVGLAGVDDVVQRLFQFDGYAFCELDFGAAGVTRDVERRPIAPPRLHD